MRAPAATAPGDAVEARLEADVRLCAEPRDHRLQPEANRRTREWLADELSSAGFRVTIQGELANVVALPGRRGPLRLVGAHYDSVPMSPGADDNGSALAVLLEVARRRHALGDDVGLVAFNAEERGLAGSSELVDLWRRGDGPEVRAIHVLEMVGYATDAPDSQRLPLPLPGAPRVGDFLGLVANQRSRSTLRSILNAAEKPGSPPVVALSAFLGTERLVPDLFRSDHAPFWEAGIPAVMWTDTAEFRNPHYHRPSDLPDTLDYRFMAGVAELLAACLADDPAS